MLHNHFKGKKVLMTGHTGFKGSWLCKMLKFLDADVYGYSLNPPTCPSLYEIAGISEDVTSEIGDVRDYDHLSKFISDSSPEIVIHMAAQPLVRKGYDDPRETYEINVMGTVNILECLKNTPSVRSFLNVTTDKVYYTNKANEPYIETDVLNGPDPYSNSKSCSEIITGSYKRSFFSDGRCAISTARAGNVIGGGDFSKDRIIPDCVRAALSGKEILLRNPSSIRPYQHVLEPLFAYLKIIEMQTHDHDLEGSYNVGPELEDCVNTGELATLFCDNWGDGLSWRSISAQSPEETQYLMLDSTLIRNKMGIEPRWHIETAVRKTIDWTHIWDSGGDVRECMNAQIREYIEGE